MPEITDSEVRKVVKDYHDNVVIELLKLVTLSKKTKFASHTIIWLTLLGVFYDSAKEIERVGEILMMYTKARIKELKEIKKEKL